jgi:hypothetical protein
MLVSVQCTDMIVIERPLRVQEFLAAAQEHPLV